MHWIRFDVLTLRGDGTAAKGVANLRGGQLLSAVSYIVYVEVVGLVSLAD